MQKEDLRIIYMGTPDFAVAPLKALVEGGYRIVAVITMPDKPVGRHQSVLTASPVKQFAVANNLPVLQPTSLKDPGFLEELATYEADLQIVVAFRMLPQVVWDMPRLGTFNLHASLLPNYRGAAPINWAIIRGETVTGLTTFFLDKDIDTGAVIRREEVEILSTDNAGSLHDKLMVKGATLVCQTVDDILADRAERVPQAELTDSPMNPAPKLFKENCVIRWEDTTKNVNNFVRGLSPYPAARTTLVHGEGRLEMKVYEAEILPASSMVAPLPAPGTVETDGKTFLHVATSDGMVALHRLQPAGKRPMSVADFLRGFHHAGGSHFE